MLNKDLATLRHDAKALRKAFNTEVDPALKRHLQKAAQRAATDLAGALQNESYAVPPRTPWKRVSVPSRYFEELGK